MMESLKTLITFTLPQDAWLAKGLLESEGIESYLKDELTAQVQNFYSNAIGGVKLQVNESEYEKGLSVLKKGGYIITESTSEHFNNVHLTPSTDKSICPFCHSDNIGKKKHFNILTLAVYFLLGFMFPIYRNSYLCFECNKVWKFSKDASEAKL